MLNDNILGILKSVLPPERLGEIQPIELPKANAEADQPSARSKADQALKTIILEAGNVPEPEVLIMEITEEKLQELLTGAVRQGAEQALKAMPPVEPPATDVSVVKDEVTITVLR